MTAMFRVFLAILVMVGAFAQTASAQSSTPSSEPQPVPTAVSSRSVAGNSQGVSASWMELGPSGERVYTSFSLSFGLDFQSSQVGNSQTSTTMTFRDPWWSFSRTQCPSEGGFCQNLEVDYAVAQQGEFAFSDTNMVKVTVHGYVFTFKASPDLEEGNSISAKFNQTTEGPWCWYWSQNRSRRGEATLAMPNGAVLQTGPNDYSSTYIDQSMQYGQGSFVPSCDPYNYGGGKG